MKRLLPILAIMLIAGLAHADLIITEVMPNPAAVTDGLGEWFEITNNGDFPVDLSGYTIRDDGTNSFVVDPGVTIQPGTLFVFGINGDSATNGGLTVDYVYPSNFLLSNTGDEIIIENTLGDLVCEIWYDSSFPFGSGFSMYLNADGDWAAESVAYGDGDFGTPGEEGTLGYPVSTQVLPLDGIKSLYR